MSRPRIWADPADRKRIGQRSDGILTCFLPGYQDEFLYGRKITVRESRIDDNGFTVPMNIQLSVVKAYSRFVLFIDNRNVKHTYTYQELVRMGYVSQAARRPAEPVRSSESAAD